jgi:hypothetical protein
MKPMPTALWRLQVDVGAQRLQHVRAARLRRDTSIAVLGNRGAGRGRDEGRGGGDVEGMRRIAAGADDIDEVGVVGHLHAGAQLAHHRGRGGNLADGFLLHAQAGQDRRGHHRRYVSLHDQPHQVQHLVVEDFPVLDGALERFLRGDHQRTP